MKKPLPYFSFPSAFTLVELIVVIAVLAVLAAISFSTVANITSGARDSARLTDISSMKTALESYNATKWGYPLPDNAVAVTWSGNLAWSQGTFGDNTARALNTISRPKDPKWSVDYSYSITNSKKEYEIATVLEKATSFNGISKAYAQGEQYDTIIKGNFNGVALRVSSAISTWILSVPTLIASDLKDNTLEKVVFSYPKSGNEPFSYTGVANSPQAVPAGWTPKQVWSGALNTPTALPKTDTELQQLTTDLKTAYTGSPAANSETIKSLLATTDNKGYASNIVNIVGENVVVNTSNLGQPIADAYAANVSCLLHFDSNFNDTTGKVWTATNATTVASPSKFGGGSVFFNGSNDKYIQTPASTDFNFGAGEFTVDGWFYLTSSFPMGWWGLIDFRAANTYKPAFALNNQTIGFYDWGTTTFGTNLIPLNQWVHLAWVKQGTTVKTFINGTLDLTSTFAATLGSADFVRIGNSWTASTYYLDEFRITKGIARWTTSFTPPTGPSS